MKGQTEYTPELPPVNTAWCLLSSHCFFPFIWHVFNDFAHPVSISMLKLFSKIYFIFSSSQYSLNIFFDMFWQRRKKIHQRNIKQFQILTFFPVSSIFLCLFLRVISCEQKDCLCIHASLDNAYIIVVTWKKETKFKLVIRTLDTEWN